MKPIYHITTEKVWYVNSSEIILFYIQNLNYFTSLKK